MLLATFKVHLQSILFVSISPPSFKRNHQSESSHELKSLYLHRRNLKNQTFSRPQVECPTTLYSSASQNLDTLTASPIAKHSSKSQPYYLAIFNEFQGQLS